MQIEVPGAFKRLVGAHPPVATWHRTVKGAQSVRIPRTIPPMIFLAFSFCKVILTAARTLLLRFLQDLMVAEMVLQSLFSGKLGLTVLFRAENVLGNPTGGQVEI